MQKAAACTLSYLAEGSEPCCAAIAAAGAIPALAQLLPAAPEHAAQALAVLVWGSNERREVVAATGCATALAQLLVCKSCCDAAKEAAAAVLDHLSFAGPDSQAGKAAAAAIDTLGACLATSNKTVLRRLLSTLGNLACDNPQNSASILSAGALPRLQNCLRDNSPAEVSSVAHLVGNLAANLPAQREALGAAGTIPALVQLLQHENEKAAENAAWALRNLALDCPASQQAILAADGFPALAAVVQKCSDSTATNNKKRLCGGAAMALCTLAHGSEELRQQAVAAGSEVAIRRLLSLDDMDETPNQAANEALLLLSGGSPMPASRWGGKALSCGGM